MTASGPTYAEMQDPRLLPEAFRHRVLAARHERQTLVGPSTGNFGIGTGTPQLRGGRVEG